MFYILVALEQELSNNLDPTKYRLSYTGVGKINATIAAVEACLQPDCERVINYGTAGALNPLIIGDLIQIGRIYQRDMDARPMFELGYTPFERDSGPIDICQSVYTLSTGDNFVKSIPDLATDAVDMEAYAIAKVCKVFGKPFECYKYLSDFADENAAEHWNENVARGAEKFLKIL
jgi:adenosylhomocysteine nucleosidase